MYGLYLAHAGSVSLARSALVTITVACGTLVIPILGRATDARQARRHGAVAVAMSALYAAILALPTARWLFEIEPIPAGDAVGLGIVALVWALAVWALRNVRGHALELPSRTVGQAA